ncbi:MAG: hypothetical protein ABJC74_07555, partial [Gemmatimonadota bacterium]
TVTPAMRDDIFNRLKAKGVVLPDSARRGGGQLIDQQIGYDVTRYVFGRPAEFRRRAVDDPQLQAAFVLLRKAQTPKQLIDLAATAAATPASRN